MELKIQPALISVASVEQNWSEGSTVSPNTAHMLGVSPLALQQIVYAKNKGRHLAPAGSRVRGGEFYPECGAPLRPERFCAQCGEKIPTEVKFCPQCGAKQ